MAHLKTLLRGLITWRMRLELSIIWSNNTKWQIKESSMKCRNNPKLTRTSSQGSQDLIESAKWRERCNRILVKVRPDSQTKLNQSFPKAIKKMANLDSQKFTFRMNWRCPNDRNLNLLIIQKIWKTLNLVLDFDHVSGVLGFWGFGVLGFRVLGFRV